MFTPQDGAEVGLVLGVAEDGAGMGHERRVRHGTDVQHVLGVEDGAGVGHVHGVGDRVEAKHRVGELTGPGQILLHNLTFTLL